MKNDTYFSTNVNFDVDVGANHRVCPPAQCRDWARPVSTPADQNDPKNLRSSIKSASSACLKNHAATTHANTMAGSVKPLKHKGCFVTAAAA